MSSYYTLHERLMHIQCIFDSEAALTCEVTNVMESADCWCILSVKRVAKLKYKFSITLGS